MNELRHFAFFFISPIGKSMKTQANVYLTHWLLSFRRKVTISMRELLSVSPLSSRRETRRKHTAPEGRR